MEIAILPTVLLKFVEQVLPNDGQHERPLTVNDLRLGVRNERMSEIRDWSNHHLDEVEIFAARFDSDAPLESVLSHSTDDDAPAFADCASSICAPSPFAWT
jgi:hypothetical protein